MEKLIIVGSGPAGYTAALYAARAELEPLVFEGYMWGGLLQTTTEVENYPGAPNTMGPDLMLKFRAQAEEFGAKLVTDEVEALELGEGYHQVKVAGKVHGTRALIIATGATPRHLGVQGEVELAGRGVSYCATCDGAFFKEKPVAVIGGGDSAMEEAIFLSSLVSKVYLIHRRDTFRASPIMLARAREAGIEFLTPYRTLSFEGEGALEGLELENLETGDRKSLEVAGAFVAIGHHPNSELVKGKLELDPEGYILTDPGSARTRVPGVFAAGDVVDRTYRQAITAAGMGCMAALDAQRHLQGLPA